MSFAVIDESTSTPRTDAAWLDAHWMPFTGNRNFKANPRMVVGAQGAYYTDADGRKIFDGLSGLWCSGLGHGRKEVAEAMGAINQTTVELTLAMDEIAAASNAQAAGVDELNIAVEQVDEGTQNSVAIARDLADSAAAMQHSAAAMLEIMGAFKTGASRTEAVSRTGREEKQPAAVLRPQRLAA